MMLSSGDFSNVMAKDAKKSLLDRSDAEKVFRPWWDHVEDYLLNTLLVIGQVSLIFSIIIYNEIAKNS